jgi:hypothetical protein
MHMMQRMPPSNTVGCERHDPRKQRAGQRRCPVLPTCPIDKEEKYFCAEQELGQKSQKSQKTRVARDDPS